MNDTPTTPAGFYVRVRVPGHKRPYLLTSGSELTWLRLRAARFTDREKAERIAKEIAAENEGHTAEAIPVTPVRKRR